VTHLAFSPVGHHLVITSGRVARVHHFEYYVDPEGVLWDRVRGCLNAYYLSKKWAHGLAKLAPTPEAAAAEVAACQARVMTPTP
jgi:hypothetical protein